MRTKSKRAGKLEPSPVRVPKSVGKSRNVLVIGEAPTERQPTTSKFNNSARDGQAALHAGWADLLSQHAVRKPAQVAKIKALRGDVTDVDSAEADIQWYYRPEDCRDKRQSYHGQQEVFASDHGDLIPAASISSKAFVHNLEDFEALGDDKDETDFFCRFSYQPKTNRFTARGGKQQACNICETMYNPDLSWLQCQQCENWYHEDCTGLKAEAADDVREDYTCSFCTTSSKKRKR